jgi:uncharacterized cupredoxin-like copper-binding protein
LKSLFITSTLVAFLFGNNVFAADADHHHMQGAAHDDHAGMAMPGDAKKVSRTIRLDMDDAMRFTPSTVTVKHGETVKFEVRNTGHLRHEMVLGSSEALKAHAAMMLKSPGMKHAEANQISVEPGKTGDLIWQFPKAGTFDFACLEPGHFDAGMRGKVIVQ